MLVFVTKRFVNHKVLEESSRIERHVVKIRLFLGKY